MPGHCGAHVVEVLVDGLGVDVENDDDVGFQTLEAVDGEVDDAVGAGLDHPEVAQAALAGEA